MELGLFSLEKRELQEDLTAAFLYSWGSYQEDGARLFTVVHSGRMRNNGHELKHESQQERFRLDIRKTFASWRAVKQWDKLLREFLESPSLEVCRSLLDRAFEQPGLPLQLTQLWADGWISCRNLLRSLPTWLILWPYVFWIIISSCPEKILQTRLVDFQESQKTYSQVILRFNFLRIKQNAL